MRRNPDAEFHHPCPVAVMVWDQASNNWETCDEDVLLTYDTGPSPEDFQLQDDITPTCTRGHAQTQAQLDSWYTEDFQEMGERMADAREAAYENHVNYLIDKELGK